MTWWVDISKAFENKQLKLWGWRMRDKGWVGILEKRQGRNQGGRCHLREERTAKGITAEGQLYGSRWGCWGTIRWAA